MLTQQDDNWETSSAQSSEEMPKSELDSHANMAVVGRHGTVIADLEKNCRVNAFGPDCDTLTIPIKDMATKHVDPHSGEQHILVVRNALHVPAMDNNLIPPFVMREAGLVVKDTPKTHLDKPTKEDHSTFFPDEKLRTPLKLSGTFSHFPSKKPTEKEISEAEEDEKLLCVSPVTWDPHNTVCAHNGTTC